MHKLADIHGRTAVKCHLAIVSIYFVEDPTRKTSRLNLGFIKWPDPVPSKLRKTYCGQIKRHAGVSYKHATFMTRLDTMTAPMACHPSILKPPKRFLAHWYTLNHVYWVSAHYRLVAK